MLSTAPEGEQPNSSSPSVQYGLTWEPQMSAATAAGSEPGAEAAEARPLRERVGLVVDGSHAAAALGTIEAAEAAGLSQVLMIQLPTAPDTLTIFAAAAARTARIGWAPQIVPTYSRRPLVLALQALALTDVARGRLRLGAGPSHQAFIEGMYGLEQSHRWSTWASTSRCYVPRCGRARSIITDGSYRGSRFRVTAPRPCSPMML